MEPLRRAWAATPSDYRAVASAARPLLAAIDHTAAMSDVPHDIDSPPGDYPEWYYDLLARTMGDEAAAWARLPREVREAELTMLHLAFDTPDDLSTWPAELDGGVDRP